MKINSINTFSNPYSFGTSKAKRVAAGTAAGVLLLSSAACAKQQVDKKDSAPAETTTAVVETVQMPEYPRYDTYALNMEDLLKNLKYVPDNNNVILQDKQTPNSKKEGATLREIILEQYPALKKANDESLGHAAAQIIEANPLVYGLIEKNCQNIFGVDDMKLVSAVKLLDVQFINEFNKTAEPAYETFGMLLSPINVVGELAPKTDEDYIEYDNVYHAKNESFVLDSTENESTARRPKSLADAIVLNYDVEKNSPDFYALLYGVVTEPKNGRIFWGDNIAVKNLMEEWKKLGKVNDFNVMETAMKLEEAGVLQNEEFFFPEDDQRVVYTVEAGVSIDPEDVTLKNADFSTLRPTKTQISVFDSETGKQNVRTIDDLIKQYTTVDGKYVSDAKNNKIYEMDIKNAIRGNYPDAFDEDGFLIKDKDGNPVVTDFNLYPVLYNLLDQGKAVPAKDIIEKIEKQTGVKVKDKKNVVVVKKQDGSQTIIETKPCKNNKGETTTIITKRWDVNVDINNNITVTVHTPVVVVTEPRTQKPADPTTRKPADPTTRKPADPTTQKPADPTTQKPTEPTTRKPLVTLPNEDDPTRPTNPPTQTTKPTQPETEPTWCDPKPSVEPDTKPSTTRHTTTTSRPADVDDIRSTSRAPETQPSTRPTEPVTEPVTQPSTNGGCDDLPDVDADW